MCAAASVIKMMTTECGVLGVTSVDDELFTLLHRDVYQLAIYSIDDYQLVRHLNVPGIKSLSGLNGIASSVQHKSVYMPDDHNSCIRRYDLRSTFIAAMKRIVGSPVSKWPVRCRPYGLSVTPSSNLLLTCQGEPSRLVELRADSGRRVREMALQADIVYPWHSVQLTTGQFVVCHGYSSMGLHRVCVVGDDGKVTRSYGGRNGSDIGQLDCPCHLAVDEDSQFIFVADYGNHRIVLLTPTMEFVRYISERLLGPYRLHFHQATRRLFVGQFGGGITVIRL